MSIIMGKASNRIALFIIPLILSLREAFFYGSLNWGDSIELSLPDVATTEWAPLRRRRQSAEDELDEKLAPNSKRYDNTRPSGSAKTNSFDMILATLQRKHESVIDSTTDEQLDDSSSDLMNDRQPEPRIQVRSFPRRNVSLPCFPAEPDWLHYSTVQRQVTPEGLFYVKTHKTASTTVMGITIRLAKKLAERNNERYHTRFHACKSRFEHWPARLMEYRHRKRDQSFLFSVIREPTKRAISMFFHFQVSREKKEPTDHAFQEFLTDTPGSDPDYPQYYPWGSAYDHYLHYLSLDGFQVGSWKNETITTADSRQLQPKKATTNTVKTVNKILQDYDFIGITERLDESLVVLQMILGLKTSDLLHYSAKGNGNWDDHGVYIQPSFVSPGMERFFASPEWEDLSRADYLMYMAANASLDRTIDKLGRDEFDDKLDQLRHAKQLVQTHCPDIRPLYSADGKASQHDCLFSDAGFGSACFDRLEREFGI